MDISIRSAHATDSPAIAQIYNPYITDSSITFEVDPVTAADIARRLRDTQELGLPWLVAEAAGRIVGYAYASKWKGRCAYRYAVESTVYLRAGATGKGIGRKLYAALLEAVRAASIHAVIGGIALPNEPSVRLHERLDFEKVAHFKQVGYKGGRWVDVGYWQLLLL